MFVQEYPPGTVTEVRDTDGFIIDPRTGTRWPTQILSAWTADQLAELGISQVEGPAEVPVIISDRQFFQALALQGIISELQALDAVKTGAIPAQMQVFIDAIPDSVARFSATMLLSGAVEFRRDHPLVAAFMVANGWDARQVDDLWRFAASL